MLRRTILAVLLALAAQVPGMAVAQDSWLDRPLEGWNWAGMPIPNVPTDYFLNEEFCGRSARPLQTAEDAQVAAQGWTLWGPFEGGWGMTIVRGTAGFDGMCRPTGFQTFVFVDGVFAGTISPVPMDSRATGAGDLGRLFSPELSANFVRYAESDPLCCPSRPGAFVSYRIDRTESGPVLVPVSIQDRTIEG
jgi:hypothetical protein